MRIRFCFGSLCFDNGSSHFTQRTRWHIVHAVTANIPSNIRRARHIPGDDPEADDGPSQHASNVVERRKEASDGVRECSFDFLGEPLRKTEAQLAPNDRVERRARRCTGFALYIPRVRSSEVLGEIKRP